MRVLTKLQEANLEQSNECSDKDEDCVRVKCKLSCWLHAPELGVCPFLLGVKPNDKQRSAEEGYEQQGMRSMNLPDFNVNTNIPSVKIKSLRFQNFKAFEDYTLDFTNIPFSCFYGPNGCGKTTILNAIQMIPR